MASVFWSGNGQNIAQVDTLTVTAVSVGGTLTATINGKNVVYTCITGDTTSTAASAWQALLVSSSSPPEFGEITFTVATNVITCTSSQPGRPFTMTSSSGGGATVSQAHPTVNTSQSDVNNPANWNRGGSAAIPVNGDDVILQDSSVPLLYNLASLSAVQFASFTRWQSFTGTVGLPENNPAGYVEYRATYLKFTSAGTITLLLGIGSTGRGPTRERYDLGATQTILVALAAGSPQDDYSIRFLGSNASNTLTVNGTSVGVATNPGETATIASATCEGSGGTIALGAGCTFSGALTIDGATGIIDCLVPTLTAQNGANVTIGAATGLTYTTITAKANSTITMLTGGTVTTLNLQTGSIFDKSQNTQALTLTNSNFDGDSTFCFDPWSAITFTNATAMRNAVASGPITFGPGRTVKVT